MRIPKNVSTEMYRQINMEMRTAIQYYSAKCIENVQGSDTFEVITCTLFL
jgi:hypothetical protein